jgi:hypothetical protein
MKGWCNVTKNSLKGFLSPSRPVTRQIHSFSPSPSLCQPSSLTFSLISRLCKRSGMAGVGGLAASCGEICIFKLTRLCLQLSRSGQRLRGFLQFYAAVRESSRCRSESPDAPGDHQPRLLHRRRDCYCCHCRHRASHLVSAPVRGFASPAFFLSCFVLFCFVLFFFFHLFLASFFHPCLPPAPAIPCCFTTRPSLSI